jgi:hypothetical protein
MDARMPVDTPPASEPLARSHAAAEAGHESISMYVLQCRQVQQLKLRFR